MTVLFRTSLVSAILVILLGVGVEVKAADVIQRAYGTWKDSYVPPPPNTSRTCYFRIDSGYSFNEDPDANYNGGVSGESLDDAYLVEGGIGCGVLYEGLRTDLTFGYHGERDFSGWMPNAPAPGTPLLTSLTSYTLMLNFYYDLGNYSGFVPYIGMGLGFAYHDMDDVTCTVAIAGFCTPGVRQAGDEDLTFAWSATAGFGYQVSERLIFDLAYRYIDMGKADSGRSDSAFAVNPSLVMDDLTAHEIKAGFRYKLASGH